jgi:hypothetical protein
MSAIIYDFKAIGAKLRRQRLDDWWEPAKPEPEPKACPARSTRWAKCLSPQRSEVWIFPESTQP